MKYKVNDWLKIVTLDSKSKGKMIGKIGHIFQVEEISSSGLYRSTDETKCVGRSWPEDCVEPVDVIIENFQIY